MYLAVFLPQKSQAGEERERTFVCSSYEPGLQKTNCAHKQDSVLRFCGSVIWHFVKFNQQVSIGSDTNL